MALVFNGLRLVAVVVRPLVGPVLFINVISGF